MVNKFMVNTVDIPSLLELFKFCLTVEAKVIIFLGVAAMYIEEILKIWYKWKG